MPARPPRREAKADWRRVLLRVPPEIADAVRGIADRDVMAPSLNTVYVTLLREALARRAK